MLIPVGRNLLGTFYSRYMHRWELDAALDVLTMCSCHLPQSDPLRNEVLVLFVICFIVILFIYLIYMIPLAFIFLL
jgi:hypothetical protein